MDGRERSLIGRGPSFHDINRQPACAEEAPSVEFHAWGERRSDEYRFSLITSHIGPSVALGLCRYLSLLQIYKACSISGTVAMRKRTESALRVSEEEVRAQEHGGDAGRHDVRAKSA